MKHDGNVRTWCILGALMLTPHVLKLPLEQEAAQMKKKRTKLKDQSDKLLTKTEH